MSNAVAVLDPLSILASKANRAHRRAVQAAQDVLRHAKEAGDHLRDAREIAEPGTWLYWLDENFEGSQSTASLYMRIAERWDELEALISNGVTNLTLRAARDILTTRTRRAALPPVDSTARYMTWNARHGRLTLDDSQKQAADHLVAQRPAIRLDRVFQQIRVWDRALKPLTIEIEIGRHDRLVEWHDGYVTLSNRKYDKEQPGGHDRSLHIDAADYRDAFPTRIRIHASQLRFVFALTGPEAIMRLTNQVVDIRYGSYRYLLWSVDLQDAEPQPEPEDEEASDRAYKDITAGLGLLAFVPEELRAIELRNQETAQQAG